MTSIDSNAISLRLETANLVRQADGQFMVTGSVPGWLKEFDPALQAGQPFQLEETFLFFDTYLAEVDDVLEKDPAALVSSGPWSEADQTGRERNLSAMAFRVDGNLVIQLKLVHEAQLYQQAVFQKARDYSLKFERLIREREHKEILLHTIVHDLAGPLTSIHGALELMKRGRVSSRLINLALEQCNEEKLMIHSILETFVSASTLDDKRIPEEDVPDAVFHARKALASFYPAFENQGVKLQLNIEDGVDELLVAAEDDLLDRIFSNLLENALRFSPVRSTTTIALRAAPDWVTVYVMDEGPGVPDEMRESIFNRYHGGGSSGGKVGLGLYFCKITVERWGGRIGCENHPEHAGSSFWFRLRRVNQSGKSK